MLTIQTIMHIESFQMEMMKSIFDFDEMQKGLKNGPLWHRIAMLRAIDSCIATAISRYGYFHTNLQRSFYASIIWKMLSLIFVLVFFSFLARHHYATARMRCI